MTAPYTVLSAREVRVARLAQQVAPALLAKYTELGGVHHPNAVVERLIAEGRISKAGAHHMVASAAVRLLVEAGELVRAGPGSAEFTIVEASDG